MDTMHEPTIRHFYVKISKTFVHLVQYGYHENIIRPPSSPKQSDLYGANTSFASNTSSVSTLTAASHHSSLLSSEHSKLSKLIIFIPGNPGILGVYHDFLTSLWKSLSNPSQPRDNPVILAIGHNNFDHPDNCDYKADERICIDESELNFVEKSKAFQANGEPHQVEMQIMYKLIILKRLLKVQLNPKEGHSCRLTFLGHSIGAYVVLRILQDRQLAAAHAGSVLIHPALENMALTEKGSVMVRYLSFKVDVVAKLMAFVAENLLSTSVKMKLTQWFCNRDFVEASSAIVLESLAQLATVKTVTALMEMVKSELREVNKLDHEKLIKPHANRLKLIYTHGDHWVNDNNRLELSQLYPELHIEEQHTLHAFVMDPDVTVNYAIRTGLFMEEFFD